MGFSEVNIPDRERFYVKNSELGDINDLETNATENCVQAINEVDRIINGTLQYDEYIIKEDLDPAVEAKDPHLSLRKWMGSILARIGEIKGGPWFSALPKLSIRRSNKTDNSNLDNGAYHVNKKEITGTYRMVDGKKEINWDDLWQHGATHLPLPRHIVARNSQKEIYAVTPNADEIPVEGGIENQLGHPAPMGILPESDTLEMGTEQSAATLASCVRHRCYKELDHPDGCITKEKIDGVGTEMLDTLSNLAVDVDGILFQKDGDQQYAVCSEENTNINSYYLGELQKSNNGDNLYMAQGEASLAEPWGLSMTVYFSVDQAGGGSGTQIWAGGTTYEVVSGNLENGVCIDFTPGKVYEGFLTGNDKMAVRQF